MCNAFLRLALREWRKTEISSACNPPWQMQGLHEGHGAVHKEPEYSNPEHTSIAIYLDIELGELWSLGSSEAGLGAFAEIIFLEAVGSKHRHVCDCHICACAVYVTGYGVGVSVPTSCPTLD